MGRYVARSRSFKKDVMACGMLQRPRRGRTSRTLWFLYCSIASVGLLGAGGCTDTVQRSTYDTLQAIQEERCRDPRIMDCPQRQSYESYQQKRNTTTPR